MSEEPKGLRRCADCGNASDWLRNIGSGQSNKPEVTYRLLCYGCWGPHGDPPPEAIADPQPELLVDPANDPSLDDPVCQALEVRSAVLSSEGEVEEAVARFEALADRLAEFARKAKNESLHRCDDRATYCDGQNHAATFAEHEIRTIAQRIRSVSSGKGNK